MSERERSLIRGVNMNAEFSAGKVFMLSLEAAVTIVGVVEQNLAYIAAAALIFGGEKGIRWVLSKRRERREAQQIQRELQELRSTNI